MTQGPRYPNRGSPVLYGEVTGDGYTFTGTADLLNVTRNPGNSSADMGPINAITFLTAGTFKFRTLSGAEDTWTVTAGESYEGLRVISVLPGTTVGLKMRVRW